MSDDGKHKGPSRNSPYPVSRLAPPHTLVDVAREIEQADQMIGSVVGGQLEVIAAQIRSLQNEAQAILDSAQKNADLHRAECSFKKKPGTIYHLYERANATQYFSMLSPEDWGGDPPHSFQGSFRLEADMSWTEKDRIFEADKAKRVVQKLLSG